MHIQKSTARSAQAAVNGDADREKKAPRSVRTNPWAIGASVGGLTVVLTIATAAVAPDKTATVAMAIPVIGACLVTMWIRSRRSSRDEAERRAFGEKVASALYGRVLRDGLVAGVMLGVAALAIPHIAAASAVFALVAFMAVDFWVRYYGALRRLGTHRRDRAGRAR